jgi:hypothetical protein
MRLEEPIDEIHRLSIYAISAIREDFGRAKTRAAAWEPRPCPEAVAELPYDPRTPYLDEIELPRKWFR